MRVFSLCRAAVISKLEELEKALSDAGQLAFMHRIADVFFSHGELMTEFVKRIDEELLDADIGDVIAAVNKVPQDYLWCDDPPL